MKTFERDELLLLFTWMLQRLCIENNESGTITIGDLINKEDLNKYLSYTKRISYLHQIWNDIDAFKEVEIRQSQRGFFPPKEYILPPNIPQFTRIISSPTELKDIPTIVDIESDAALRITIKLEDEADKILSNYLDKCIEKWMTGGKSSRTNVKRPQGQILDICDWIVDMFNDGYGRHLCIQEKDLESVELFTALLALERDDSITIQDFNYSEGLCFDIIVSDKWLNSSKAEDVLSGSFEYDAFVGAIFYEGKDVRTVQEGRGLIPRKILDKTICHDTPRYSYEHMLEKSDLAKYRSAIRHFNNNFRGKLKLRDDIDFPTDISKFKFLSITNTHVQVSKVFTARISQVA